MTNRARCSFEAHADGETVVLRLGGEIDYSVRDELRAAVAGALEGAATDVVVDASSVGYVDSTGVHLLMHMHQVVRERNGSVTVTDPPPMLRKIVSICGIEHLVAFDPPDPTERVQPPSLDAGTE